MTNCNSQGVQSCVPPTAALMDTPRAGLPSGPLTTYLAFALSGAGCGLFVMNSLFNLLANVRETQQDGRMYGTFSMLGGAVGMAVSGVFFLQKLVRPRLPIAVEQGATLCLILAQFACFTVLALNWQARPPDYPVIVGAAAVGQIIPCLTYFIMFPLLSTYYGGWLIAPVRAGTDISSLITTLAAEFQNPTGSRNRFPSRLLFATYAMLSLIACGAWLWILRTGAGLRGDVQSSGLDGKKEQSEEEEEERQPASSWTLRGFACPRSLLGPVMGGTLVQVVQWDVAVNVMMIGASMTDPDGCDGPQGAFVNRTALTSAWVLVPLGSLISSLAPCARRTFYALTFLQLVSLAFICGAVFGTPRSFWVTWQGQLLYMLSITVCGGLEGYVTTMAYRYLGDAEGVPLSLRQSASSLLSLLSVVVINPIGIVVGWLISTGRIACRDP